jgi:hypothetical protein
MDHNITSKGRASAKSRTLVSAREHSEDEVRFRAYEIYVSRNREPGHELDDWLQAERELLSGN